MVRPSRNTPMAPQTISTGRLPSTRPMPPGSGRQPGFWRRGSGHRTASATNETTSTIAAAQPNSHSGMGRSDRTEIPCPIRNTGGSPGFDYEGSDQRIAAGVLGHVTLDLELALEVRLEPEPRGLAGRDLLLDVVAMQVDVVRRVSGHHDHNGVALLDPDLGGAAADRASANVDPGDHGPRLGGRIGLSVGSAVLPGLSGASGLGRGFALVIPARARDPEREHGHQRGRDDQPDALIPRHAAPK